MMAKDCEEILPHFTFFPGCSSCSRSGAVTFYLQALSAVILTVGLSINEPSNGTSAKFVNGRR
jgi:hypothetical protein